MADFQLKHITIPADGPADIQETLNRFLRGHQVLSHARNCRCAYRNHWHPDNRNHNLGFRFVLASSSRERTDVLC